MSYPEDCLQFVLGQDWWVESDAGRATRGQLIWAFLPHVHQQQLVLVPTGRTDPTKHDLADFEVVPLQARQPPPTAQLPVAALPHYAGEVSAVYRAKRRPALVISTGGVDVPRALRVGGARHQTTPTMLVAPFYSIGGGRSGAWRPELVQRIRRCEYPQYLWDYLPIPGGRESVLRLDQIQPIGRHGSAFEATGYCLSEDALLVLDEWLGWVLQGSLVKDGIVQFVRSALLEKA